MPGRLTPPTPERLAPQWRISALTSVPWRMAGRGMDDEAGGLVEDDEMLVLEHDGERRDPRRRGRVLGGGRDDGDFRALGQFGRMRDRATDAVDRNLARLDQRLEPRARQREPPLARRVAEETIEPFAGLTRADLEIDDALGGDQRGPPTGGEATGPVRRPRRTPRSSRRGSWPWRS